MEEINIQVNDPSTPESILQPITYASWILGVGIARPMNCPKWVTIIIRVIHFCVCSVIVAYSAMDFSNFGKEFTSELFEIMYCVNESVSHIAHYYYVCHIAVHYDKWPELMNKMQSLYQNIRRELTIDDRCVRIRQILAILIVILCGPLSLIAHVLYYYFIAPDQIYISDLLLYYTIAQILINSFVFDIIVYVIYRRFKAVSEMIGQLDGRLGAYWTAIKIRRIRKLHNEIYSIIITVNEIYGIDLLLCSTNAFIMVVSKLFRIYMSAVEKKTGFILLNNVIWIIYGVQFIMMCWVCTLTHREINKIGICTMNFALNQHCTKNKLSSFKNFRINAREQLESNFERDNVRNEINDFLLQLQQYRNAFTACDFFEMDHSLLTRFISVITTYLIILVQFYKPGFL